jgi:hypothetical protein
LRAGPPGDHAVPIEEFRVVHRDEALAKLDEHLARRIALALSALARDGAIYAEEGAEPTPAANAGRPLCR